MSYIACTWFTLQNKSNYLSTPYRYPSQNYPNFSPKICPTYFLWRSMSLCCCRADSPIWHPLGSNRQRHGTCFQSSMCFPAMTISKVKERYLLYSAVSSTLTAQSTLHFSSPGRPVHSGTNSASPGSILATQQLRNDYSLIFSPPSIAMLLIYTAEWSAVSWREQKLR